MTTFDRYLLGRYVHVFVVFFVALFGLYVIFHAFTNSDEFMDPKKGTLEVLLDMGRFYSYRSSQFLSLIGGTIAVIAATVVFALVLRHGELNPILSAGIPTYRLMRPVLTGAIVVNLLLIANQELIIPQIASHLQVEAGQGKDVRDEVEPVYDFVTQVLVTGKRLHLLEQKIELAEFVLPFPQIADELTTVKAAEAIYHPAAGDQPGGWQLIGASHRFDELRLTPRGREIVRTGAVPGELFIATDVSFDRLYKSDKNFQYLSTPELRRRIRNPSFSSISIRRQCLHLHSRCTQPLINLIAVLLSMPLVVRKEARGLITSLALAGGAVGFTFGVNQAFLYLGGAHVLAADLAAWAPVILLGTLSSAASGLVRT